MIATASDMSSHDPSTHDGAAKLRRIFALSRRAQGLAGVLRRIAQRRHADYEELLVELARDYRLDVEVVRDVVGREL